MVIRPASSIFNFLPVAVHGPVEQRENDVNSPRAGTTEQRPGTAVLDVALMSAT
jgi:hypothetical protein